MLYSIDIDRDMYRCLLSETKDEKGSTHFAKKCNYLSKSACSREWALC